MEKELFKAIYGELIDLKYADLPSELLVRVAMGAVSQFAEKEGVKVEWLCINNEKNVCK